MKVKFGIFADMHIDIMHDGEERLEAFLNDLISNSDLQDKTVLISTHGASLCGILRLMKGWPMDKFWGDGVHKNCAVSLAEYKDGKIDVLWENITYYKAEVENW